MVRLKKPLLAVLALLLVFNRTRVFALVLLSLAAHEAAHAAVAKSYGGKVQAVGLTWLGFVAQVRQLDTLRFRHRVLVYLAGPATNALIAAWAFTVHHLSYVGVVWLRDLAFYNAVLCVFNMLPTLPLDGGRLTQLFLGNRIGILRANRFLLKLGRAMGRVMMVLGMVQVVLYPFNITLLCAGRYIVQKNRMLSPDFQLECYQALRQKPLIYHGIRRLPVKTIHIPARMTVGQALARLTWSHDIVFCLDGNPRLCVKEMALLDYVFYSQDIPAAACLHMPMIVLTTNL